MEHSISRDANSHSASQEIPQILWNPNVHCHVHKRQPLVPNLSHMNPVQNFPHFSSNIQSNIILSFMSRSSEWSLPLRFSDQTFVCIPHLLHAGYTPRLVHHS